MSLITRCPSCGTQFKVVPDQLKISHGWVRCGHCAEVFDASQRLENAAKLSPSAEVATQDATADTRANATDFVASEPEDDSASGAIDAEDTALTEAKDDAASIALQETAPSPLRPHPRELSAATVPSFAEELAALAERSNQQSVWPEGQGNSRFNMESVVEWSESSPKPIHSDDGEGPFADSQAGENAKEQSAALSQISFVRLARRKAFWRHPLVRLCSSLVCVALTVLLVAQVALQQRDRLAVTEPQLKPYLQQLCEWADCQIRPLRQIESIAIDSSSFNKAQVDARQETYTLSFVIKNNAAVPLSAPTLELTLTDTQDSPVLRRTITPAEYGARSELMGAGAEVNSSVALAVSLGASALPPGRVAGYRLLAFYP